MDSSLLVAIWDDDIDQVEGLISEGQDLELRDEDGYIALHLCPSPVRYSP